MNTQLHMSFGSRNALLLTLIAGKGIVTSEGAYWKSQRTLLSHAFRVNILEETADVAKRAVDRLSAKLEVCGHYHIFWCA